MRPRLWRATLAGTVTAVAAVGLVPGVATAASPDLFISEYVEGSGNNKAVEIYNGTGAPVDLSGYALRFHFNGATSFSSVPLTGVPKVYFSSMPGLNVGSVWTVIGKLPSLPPLASVVRTAGVSNTVSALSPAAKLP